MKDILWKIINSFQGLSIIPLYIRRRILLMTGIQLSENASIAETVFLGSNKLEMGKETFVNIGTFLDGCGKITIEDYVRIGPYVKILTGTHKYRNSVIRRRTEDGLLSKPVVIKRGCWVGMGSIILPGVTIAEGCIIAAGSVVIKDTEPNGLYAGNPAKRVKELSIEDDLL